MFNFRPLFQSALFLKRVDYNHGFSIFFDTPEVTKNSSTKSSAKFYIAPVGPGHWIKKVSRVTYNTGRDKGSPSQLYSALRDFTRKKIPPKGPLSFFRHCETFFSCEQKFFGCCRREYFDTWKSFCCFWALDMALSWAGSCFFLDVSQFLDDQTWRIFYNPS